MKKYVCHGIAACLLLNGVAMGATAVFDPITGDWDVPANWDIGVVPTAADDARVQAGGIASQAHITTANAVCDRLLQENGGGLTIESGGILATRQVLIGNATSSRGSTITLDGGQLNCAAEFALGNNAGGATMIINSGTVNANGSWLIAGYKTGSGGAIVMDGGALNSTGILRPGYEGDGSLVVNDGVVYTDSELRVVSGSEDAIGQVVVNGGTLSATGLSFPLGSATTYFNGGEVTVRNGGINQTTNTLFHFSGGELIFDGALAVYSNVVSLVSGPNWKFHGSPSVVSNLDGTVVVSCIPDPNIVTNATVSTGVGDVLGDTSDDFQNATVTASSELHSAGFVAADLFTHGSPSMVKEDAVFNDWRGGVYSFVDFEIAGPITLTNLVIGLGNDEVSGSMNRRTVSNIRVYAGLTPETVKDNLVADIDLDPEYTAAYGDRIPIVDMDLDVNGQFFRVEFMEPWDSGARVYEIDGYGAAYAPPPARPAEILDFSVEPSGILRFVIDAPDLASRYHPESTENLLLDGANILHAKAPAGPYYTTNLSYSTSEGTNKVIYVVPTPTAVSEFFTIVGE